MGFVSMSLFKVFVALQLSLLLMTSTISGEVDVEGFEIMSKTVASPAPAPAPSYRWRPIRSFVAVQGVVYCKSCKYHGIDTLLGASPLSGAIVKLQCNSSRSPISVEGKADKNGYFFIRVPKKVSSYGTHKCKVFLVSSPLAYCNKPTNLNWGLSGAYLRYQKPSVPIPFTLYTVGPFAFAPTKCHY